MSAKFQNKGEGDLFEQLQVKDRATGRKARFILPRLRKSVEFSYENVIFLAIVFIMSSLIFFSLGVEKGRRDGTKGIAPEKTAGTVKVEAEGPVSDMRAEKHSKNRYAVQLAAFTSIRSAEQEAGGLKREGYQAAIEKSGNYYQVFLGGFEDTRSAEKVLKKMKERYRDAYIKKAEED